MTNKTPYPIIFTHQSTRYAKAHHWARLWSEENDASENDILGEAWLLAERPLSDTVAVALLNTVTLQENCQSRDTEIRSFDKDPYPAAGIAQIVHSALIELTPQEHRVILLRNGIGFCAKPHTLQEISDHWGITRHAIRRIENKAMRKIKRNGYSNRLRYLLD